MNLRGLAILLAAAALPACSGNMQINTERSTTVNFAVYRTYAWKPTSPTQPRSDLPAPSDLLDWRIRNAVETQLAAKGYVLSRDSPDFLVDYRIMRKQKSADSIQEFIKYRESGGQDMLQEAYVFGYEEAKLILEIYDAASDRVAWRATATTADVNHEKQTALVNEAVQRLLQQFPPP